MHARPLIHALLGSLVFLSLAAFLSGCVTNAATGQRQLDYFSREDEIALGLEAGPQLTQEYGGAVTDPDLNRYVTGVVMSMTPHTEADYPSMPWKVTLLNSPVINAFALPGGQVFLSRGLAEKFTTEAQLAGVLGHEIGHVTAEHADRSVSRQMVLQGVAVVAGTVAGDSGMLQQAAGVLVNASGTFALKFNREQENEADMLGMRYMTKAGYHPKGMLEVMQVLAKESAGQSPPEWQSTHPNPDTRIGIIKERLNSDTYRRLIAERDLQEHQPRFQREFLDRIRRLPPAPRPQQGALEIDLEHPASWCAHCALAAANLSGR